MFEISRNLHQNLITNKYKDDQCDAKIGIENIPEKEVSYYNQCRFGYTHDADQKSKVLESKGNPSEAAYVDPFENIKCCVLDNQQPITAKSLYEKFVFICKSRKADDKLFGEKAKVFLEGNET